MHFRSRTKPLWTGLACVVVLYGLFVHARGRPRFNRVFVTSTNGASSDTDGDLEPALFHAYSLLKQPTNTGNGGEDVDICERCNADPAWERARQNALILKGGAHLLTTLIREKTNRASSPTSDSADSRFAELVEAVSRNVMLFPLVDQQHIFIADPQVKDLLHTVLLRKGMAQATIAAAVNYIVVSEKPSYGQLFRYANRHLQGHVVVVHLPDIHFDEQLACTFVAGLRRPPHRAVMAMQRKAVGRGANKPRSLEGVARVNPDNARRLVERHNVQETTPSDLSQSGLSQSGLSPSEVSPMVRRSSVNDVAIESTLHTSATTASQHAAASSLIERLGSSQQLLHEQQQSADEPDGSSSNEHEMLVDEQDAYLRQLSSTSASTSMSTSADGMSNEDTLLQTSSRRRRAETTHGDSSSSSSSSMHVKRIGGSTSASKFRAFALTRHPAKDCPAGSGGDPFSPTIPQNMCTTLWKSQSPTTNNQHGSRRGNNNNNASPSFMDSFDSFVFVPPLARYVVAATNRTTPDMIGSAKEVVHAMAQTGLWVSDPCFDLVSYHLQCEGGVPTAAEPEARKAHAKAKSKRSDTRNVWGESTFDGNTKKGRVNGRTRIKLCSSLLHDCFAAGCD